MTAVGVNPARLAAHEALKARRARMAGPALRHAPVPPLAPAPCAAQRPVGASARRVVAVVAAHYGLELDDLRGRSQARRVSRPRQVAMVLCHRVLGYSMERCAAALGRVNHTTVLCALRAVDARAAADPAFAAELGELRARVRAVLAPRG